MDNISLGQAFAHVSQSTSYWVWLIIASCLSIGVFVVLIKKYKNGDLEGKDVAKFGAIALVIFLFALLMRPCEVAANTTKEQAARGVYIGY